VNFLSEDPGAAHAQVYDTKSKEEEGYQGKRTHEVENDHKTYLDGSTGD
jgi:hypothetical protein